jgi:aldehyde dehydrogenase (NAD+)
MVAQGQIVDEAPETGFYQAPTLLRDVPVNHRLAQDEVFGPVLSAMRFRDEDHAVELANATPFGLVAGVWTRDGARQFRMAQTHAQRPGLHQQLRRRRRRGTALRRREVTRATGARKGFEALYGFTTLKTVAIRHG